MDDERIFLDVIEIFGGGLTEQSFLNLSEKLTRVELIVFSSFLDPLLGMETKHLMAAGRFITDTVATVPHCTEPGVRIPNRTSGLESGRCSRRPDLFWSSRQKASFREANRDEAPDDRTCVRS